jgi:hypothetical protein
MSDELLFLSPSTIFLLKRCPDYWYQKLLTISQNWGTLDVEFVWTTALFINSIHAESVFDGCPVFLEFVTVGAFDLPNAPLILLKNHDLVGVSLVGTQRFSGTRDNARNYDYLL